MPNSPSHVESVTDHRMSGEDRKLLASTLAGTTIEWYDFFIYAQAASLVLGPLFLAPVSADAPGLATIISLATIGISFLFRPLGAIVAGRFGDRLGRKKMLVFTLLLMGASTVLIGALPTYAQIGVAAPVLLIVLRILQGFSAGGEWGGAALMSVEGAPANRRGLFGAYPQIGVPIGLILATAVLWVLSSLLTPEQFQAWGWRVPFLLSVGLIVVGFLIRQAVEESPVFKEMLERKKASSAPLRDLFAEQFEAGHSRRADLHRQQRGRIPDHRVLHRLRQQCAGTGPRPRYCWRRVGSVGWLIFTLWGGTPVRPHRSGPDLPDRVRLDLHVDDPDVLLMETRNIWLFGLACW